MSCSSSSRFSSSCAIHHAPGRAGPGSQYGENHAPETDANRPGWSKAIPAAMFAPVPRPVKKPMTRFVITAGLPPTAARAAGPRQRPTTMASTVLYN